MSKFCGPSNTEKNIELQQENLARTMDAAFSQRFSGQNDVLMQLKSQLSQLDSGMTPEGFAAPELAAMTTSIINASGAASREAQQAAGNFVAGEGGGGGSGITSGIAAQIRGSIASDIASKKAAALGQLTQLNYATGRENAAKSIAGLQALAGQYDPAQYSQQAGSGYQTAFGEADKIKQEQNQASAGLFGAIAGIAKPLLGMIPGVGPLISGILPGGKKGGSNFGADVGIGGGDLFGSGNYGAGTGA